MKTPKVLFASSEIYPLMKTGGLGDVAGSLPRALSALGCDMRLVMPAYRDAIDRTRSVRKVADLSLSGSENATHVSILEAVLPGTRLKVWLVDHPPSFNRHGNPYMDAQGNPWPDNAARFALFSRTIASLAAGQAGLEWQPDVLHCHDWQTALAPALLSDTPNRPTLLFTVHNLSYQGVFPQETFTALNLPDRLWSPDALEHYGQMNFIKGGLCFADYLTTVSPTYAREIQAPDFGCGLHELLQHRSDRLIGILNSIDRDIWNPGTDSCLVHTYNWRQLQHKQDNKRALQKRYGLAVSDAIPLIGMVGRLVHQKGVDLLIEALPTLMEKQLQLVILGTGDRHYEQQLQSIEDSYRGRLAVHIGYEEASAHRIAGGADAFLIPSRFEPCGLTQLYSQRYGTVPVVRAVGGLTDTVTDTTEQTLASGTATGLVFQNADTGDMLGAIDRALALYQQPDLWKQIVRNGMRQKWSWQQSARQYLALYRNRFSETAKADTLGSPGSE